MKTRSCTEKEYETSVTKEKVGKLLVVGQLPPPCHGSTVMADVFCKSLIEIGHNIKVVEKNFSKKIAEVEKISINKILKIPIVGINLIRKLFTFRPSVCFYFLSVKPPSVYVDMIFFLIIYLMGFQTVLYFHGKGYRKIFYNSGKLKKLLFFKIFSLAYGGITLGHSIIGDVQWFLPQKKILILPNCILGRKNFYKKTWKKYVQFFFLSNLIESKGPIQVLKVARSINKIHKNVRFILAGAYGSEFLMGKIFNFILKENLKDFVLVPGPVYGSEKDKLFVESDIFIYPTSNDCFPLVLLEAMEAGLPVITSKEGCIPEIIQNGICGYLIEPNNISEMTKKAIKLIENEGLRRNMGLKGKEILDSKFSYKQYKKNLVNAIDQILT